MKVFNLNIAGAALRCPQREGIIASEFSGKKWDN